MTIAVDLGRKAKKTNKAITATAQIGTALDWGSNSCEYENRQRQ